MNRGFIGLVFLILVGAGFALYFVKDESGKSYIDVLFKKKEQVIKEVDGYKKMMNQRDAEIEKNLR